jgi:Domain of unknown function (DUF3883)
MPNKILFCNIGWMKNYQGQTTDDKIIGGGRYVKIEKRGHEVCNFVRNGQRVYGYVQPVGDRIVIQKLGANKDAEFIDNIDVVITALRPGGDTVIVGWFKNARVFERIQKIKKPSDLHVSNAVDGYRYEASRKNVKLLLPEMRTFIVPRGKGGLGQSPVWYAEKAASTWLVNVRRFIDGSEFQPVQKNGKRNKPDHFMNAVVEEAAMSYVWSHYSSKGYEVEDVSKQNLGWDIEAVSGKLKLRIEVKGLSGTLAKAELTPNEYKALTENSYTYRLCIVNDVLHKPSLSTCYFNLASNEWAVENYSKFRKIKVTERIAASILLS